MSITDKLNTIEQNVPRVYESGKSEGKTEGHREIWESIQNGGAWLNCDSKFRQQNWRKSTFLPIYNFKPTTLYQCFHETPFSYSGFTANDTVNTSELEAQQGIVFDYSKCTDFYRAFAGGLFSQHNTVDLKSATSLSYAFYQGPVSTAQQNAGICLKRIEHLICYESTPFSSTMFGSCQGLTYIGFEGVIATSGLNLSSSTKLEKDSILSLFSVLSDTASGKSVTLSKTAVNNAFESSESDEWLSLVATKPNWTIVLA